MLSVNGGWDFARVLIALDKEGYDAEWSVLNSKHFGVAQNRNRCFVVGHLRNGCESKFVLDRWNEKDTGQPSSQICTRTIVRRYPGNLNGTFISDLHGIRAMSPKECFRLQGWSDDYFEKAEFVNSDSKLYKQAGNGVTVTVIKAIAENFNE